MEEKQAPHVHKAMLAVKMELAAHGGITKDRKAPDQIGGYAFRGIDDADNVLCGLTAKHSLVLYPRVVHEQSETQVDGKGRMQRHVKLTLEIDIVSAVDGSQHVVRTVGEGIDSGDKATGKAFSNARKMGVFGAFQIPTHGENVEEYATQVAPVQQGSTAPVLPSGGHEGATAAQPEAVTTPGPGPAKAKRAPRQPKPDVTEPWADPNAGPAPNPEALMARIGEVNTFPVLHAFAVDADQLTQGPERAEVFKAIEHRGIALFAACQSAAEVKEGLELWKAVGRPEELARAGNAAYSRFRNGAR